MSPLGVWRNPRVAFGMLVVLALTIAAAGAPWLSPHDPLEQDLLNSFQAPAWSGADAAHVLGTDSLGRDTLSRLIFGARAALIVAFVAALFAGLLGTILGLAAGYFGGRLDAVISRLVDVWMSFPSVLLCIVLAAVLGAGLHTVVIAIIVIDWTRFCRVVRSEVIVQNSHDYVASAMTIGLSSWRVLISEILPNVAPLLLTLFTLEMGIAIVVEAILSYVGLSVSSGVPTWGGIIQEGRLYVNQAWWLMALPMACIVMAVLGLNALGDGLREAFDPVESR
ncbi:MAG TPA: ABC transporter permease [Burkholderiales bacterium]|nr:ABC transporter permease [Burkholderiales bacterium]